MRKRHVIDVNPMCPDLDVDKKVVDDAKPSSNKVNQIPTVHHSLQLQLQKLHYTIRTGDKLNVMFVCMCVCMCVCVCVCTYVCKQKEVNTKDPSPKYYIPNKTTPPLELMSNEEVRLCHLFLKADKCSQPRNLYKIKKLEIWGRRRRRFI